MKNIVTIPWTAHSWLREINLAFLPGKTTPLLDVFTSNLLNQFQKGGHFLQKEPNSSTDIIITTATFGEPLRWRDSLMLTARRRYKLEHAPTVFTLIPVKPQDLAEILKHFEISLAKIPIDPADFAFPGLTSDAYRTLAEQGRRGGPILSLMRVLQSQSMSIRIILVVGDDVPIEAFTFDLVGAYPCSHASDPHFYEDLMYRVVTAVSTHEITAHQLVEPPISQETWQKLSTPPAMRSAGLELGARGFFTEMIVITNLVNVPSLHDAISSQYSEGCFASWDAHLGGLIATITGSARPVDKVNLTDDELAVIVGVRLDGKGALIRYVDGKRNDPPSSEAVELVEMDSGLPWITIVEQDGLSYKVPVARSKLHGHRGVKGFNPTFVEHVELDAAYYHYPVSCSTEAQARAIRSAFSRSVSLNKPDDPRQVVFTVLPGHGTVIVEKWVDGKVPFQVIWEYMDAGRIQIDNLVPQGPLIFEATPNEMRSLHIL